ncbi:hypothetical protein E2C01_021399 [Portunus trituberculatus]|uniref:Uncharacterized protein n=1 Tax=Portunus trituberculatus TaxID=210409 RepID=A0A5B7E4J5_PORTR|nr:hypothetical protein [Portunus trituberculatus]
MCMAVQVDKPTLIGPESRTFASFIPVPPLPECCPGLPLRVSELRSRLWKLNANGPDERGDACSNLGGKTVHRGTRQEVVRDLTEEFKEELVAVRQKYEGRTEVVESKVEEVREEVTRLRCSLEKKSLGMWGRSKYSEPAGQGRSYASSEPGDVGCCGGRTQSTHLWYALAPEDDAITPPQTPPPPSVAGSAWHVGGTSVQHKPVEFGRQVAWEAYQAQFELLAQG